MAIKKQAVKRCFFCNEGLLIEEIPFLARILGTSKRICDACLEDLEHGKKRVEWKPPNDLKEAIWPPNLSQ